MSEHRAEYYERQAEECLREAGKSTSELDHDRWLQMAREWYQLAAGLRRTQALPTRNSRTRG
jgi:hypothetical protein